MMYGQWLSLAGDERFCAAADLSAGSDTFNADRRQRSGATAKTIDGVPRDGGGQVSLRVAASLKPVIAAINGPAVGVGVTMTLPMDIRLAADNAKFGFVFSRRGLVMEAASSWFLPRVVGISQALEWVATGRVEGISAFLEKRPSRFPMRISTDLPDLGPQWPEPPGYHT